MAEEGVIKCYHFQSESLRGPAASGERTGCISGSQRPGSIPKTQNFDNGSTTSFSESLSDFYKTPNFCKLLNHAD